MKHLVVSMINNKYWDATFDLPGKDNCRAAGQVNPITIVQVVDEFCVDLLDCISDQDKQEIVSAVKDAIQMEFENENEDVYEPGDREPFFPTPECNACGNCTPCRCDGTGNG